MSKSFSSIYYLDTSAIIKFYIKEIGSEVVSKILKQKSAVFITASITYAEIVATFVRLRRDGYISKASAEELCKRFDLDWQEFNVIDFRPEVMQTCRSIAFEANLKGADLVQLGSALLFHQLKLPLLFVCFDQKLINAATDLGLPRFE